ncbi:MAG: HAD-IB family phosphatase [Akkermansia sp.]
MSGERKVALFDMDGTLFPVDSQLRFAGWVLRRHGLRRLYLGAVLPCGILRALHVLNTEQMKRIFLCYAWCMPVEQLREECEAFVQMELLPATFPEVLARLRAHQSAGDRTVLCSASPEWWTRPLGRALGFDEVIGTPFEPFERVPFAPTIPAPGNNKGENKLLRLAEKGITRADYGYTDSTADLPMLSICSRAVLVNPSPKLLSACPGADVIKTPPYPRRRVALAALLGLPY